VQERKGFEDGSWRDGWRRRREKERELQGEGEGAAWWLLRSVAEIPFALSRGGLFFAAHKMAAAPPGSSTWLEDIEGSNFLHPALFIPYSFVRSFVRSLARAASLSPLPTPLLAYTTSPLSLSLSLSLFFLSL